MKITLIILCTVNCLTGFSNNKNRFTIYNSVLQKEIPADSVIEKLKFVIICFQLSPTSETEISDLNTLAGEYRKYVLPVVIKDDDLSKYKELFTRNEFRSLQDFVSHKKPEYEKNATGFPVILILDKNGKVKNAWSGDKTDGLKREDFYIKIKAGLDAIAK